MKKIALLLSALLLAALFSACGGPADPSGPESSAAESAVSESSAVKVDVNIAVLKGPTAMGLVGVMDSAEKGGTAGNYVFTVAGSADEITPKLIKGELDIAAVPANLASVLYNKTEGKIRVMAINTLGVLYIVDKGGEVAELSDLRGKSKAAG